MVQSSGPRPLVLCGPSGSGKSTLIHHLFDDFPDTFGFSVSHTTRAPRPNEKSGLHYNFTTKEEMQAGIDRGDFIEHASFSGNIYGTSKAAIETVQSTGKVCVLDIDVQGVKQIKNTSLNPLIVFVKPPSLEELEHRLRGRATETEESIQLRLERAKEEMEYSEHPGSFDLVIINENLKKTYSVLKEFIINELKKQKAEGIFVNHMP